MLSTQQYSQLISPDFPFQKKQINEILITKMPMQIMKNNEIDYEYKDQSSNSDSEYIYLSNQQSNKSDYENDDQQSNKSDLSININRAKEIDQIQQPLQLILKKIEMANCQQFQQPYWQQLENLNQSQMLIKLMSKEMNQLQKLVKNIISNQPNQRSYKYDKNHLFLKKILIRQCNSYYLNYPQNIQNMSFTKGIMEKLLQIYSENDLYFMQNKDDHLCKAVKMLFDQCMGKKIARTNGKSFQLQQMMNDGPKIRQFKGSKQLTKVNTYDSEQMQELKNMIINMQKNDYAYFYTIEDRFYWLVHQILSKYEFYKIFIQSYLKKLMDIIKAKYNCYRYSDQVYEKLYQLKKKIQYKIKYEGMKGETKFYEHKTDNLYVNYIRQTEERSSRVIYTMVKDSKKQKKIPLIDYIGTYPEYEGYRGQAWRNILFKITQILKKYDQYYDYKKRQAQRELGKRCSREVLPKNECLGCQKYFISKWDVANSQSKVKLALLGDINEINQNEKLIKEQICGMLNQQGGVLLFNCKTIYLNLVSHGSAIKISQKKSIQQTIQKYLQDIEPKPKFGQNVVLSFVPIMQSPLDPISGRGEKKRVFTKYFYVVRLVIRPQNGSTIYFWNKNNPTITVRYKSLVQEGKKQLKGKQLYNFVYSKNLQFANELGQQNEPLSVAKYVMRKNFCFFNHKCLQPDVGQFQPDGVQPIDKNENNYTYASLLIARRDNHPKIVEAFRKNNIYCFIKYPYEDVKLKAAKTSSVIYHNVIGQELMKMIKNNEHFQFERKQIIIVPITDFIKLPDRKPNNQLPLDDCLSLTKWLYNQYPEDKLELLEYTGQEGEKQYYIHTKSFQSRLYIFMILNNFQQKAVFRNPTPKTQNYNIRQHMQVLYPSPNYNVKRIQKKQEQQN